MKKLQLEDKKLIKAYTKWCVVQGFFPSEYECSKLIQNMNCDVRDSVDNYLSELRLKQYNNEL